MCVWLCVLVMSNSDSMNCSPPRTSVHWILQARILECAAIPFSRGSSWPRDGTWVSWIAGRIFTVWVTRLPWWLRHNWTSAQLWTDQSLVYILSLNLTEISIYYIKLGQPHYIYYHKFASLFFYQCFHRVSFFYLDFPSF